MTKTAPFISFEERLRGYFKILALGVIQTRSASAGDSPILFVQKAVARICNVSVELQTGKSKPNHIVSARTFSMFICYVWKLGSFNQVGLQFGGRDHATVLAARKRFINMIQMEPLAWEPRFLDCLRDLAGLQPGEVVLHEGAPAMAGSVAM